MKIAINRCYGGFSLSDKAIEMIMKRKGLECCRYIQTKYSFEDGVNEFTKVTSNDDYLSRLAFYTTKDFGDVVNEIPDEYWWYYRKCLERTDSDLIAVIEELGDDASGAFGNIRIVEVPDDVD